MIYVFEDKASDLLSLLYQAAYPPDVAGKFIYAEGSTKLPFRVGELAMQFPEEKIVVFMDIVPDNNHLLVIYNKLRKMAIAGTQVLVIPCICSEYYFIEAYHSTSVFKCGEGVDIALEVRPWKQSQLLYTPADLQFCKNFERYCKLILRKCVRQCATHSRLYKGRENPLYGLFYTRDCPCGEDKCVGCGAQDLTSKALQYVSQYPCVPCDSLYPNPVGTLSWDACIKLNHRLCEKHNARCTLEGWEGTMRIREWPDMHTYQAAQS